MVIEFEGPVETDIPIKAPHSEAIHYENLKYYRYLFGYRYSSFITNNKTLESSK